MKKKNIIDKYAEAFDEMPRKKTKRGKWFTICLSNGKLTTVFIPVKNS